MPTLKPKPTMDPKPERPKPGDADVRGRELARRVTNRLELRAAVYGLESLTQAVFHSLSWRAGQWLGWLLGRLGLRIPVSTAKSDLLRIIDELRVLAEMPAGHTAAKPGEILLATHFRPSESTPKRFPVIAPRRPSQWEVDKALLEEIREHLAQWPNQPLISIVIPVYNIKAEWLRAAISSVFEQFYPRWELILVDDGSTQGETLKFLREIMRDERVTVRFRSATGGIVAATNDALAIASGDFIAFVDDDDILEPDALLQVARAIVETRAEIVYTDEDKTDAGGHHNYDAHHKPAYNDDLLLSQNYISHLMVIQRKLIERVGRLQPGFDGSQDHDLLLRCVELTDQITHVPMVLYHWRAVPGSTAYSYQEKCTPWENGRLAVAEAMRRRGVQSQVKRGPRPGTYTVKRAIRGEPLVSILIPFRDKPELLRRCCESIIQKSRYANFEIVGVNNQSEKAATRKLMDRLTEHDKRIRFIEYDKAFNFSALNNFAVDQARGEHVLLLNNDTEVIEGDWLGAMLQHSQREQIGAVGAKLLYTNGKIQHAGVILGIGGVAGHSHKRVRDNDNGYFSRPHLIQNVSAVTAACLMVKRSLYEELDGLNETQLAVAFNDIDFCLRLRERGYLNVYTPEAVLFHHESITRGYEDSKEKQRRFGNEVDYMRRRHGAALSEVDPYYNPNLSQSSECFSLR